VLALLETPLAGLLAAAARGELGDEPALRWKDGSAVTVVLAAHGYPQAPRTGDPVSGADAPGILHAGTARREGVTVSSGGRVLSIVATGSTLAEARATAYELLSGVSLEGSHYRSDIALEASR
jgi:phosphoribosylamine--glycine ligase